MQNSKRIKKSIPYYLVCFGILTFAFLSSCAKEEKHGEGRRLAEVYCAACHLYTDPTILPRRVWGDKVIPSMGLKMGMSHGPIYSYSDTESINDLIPVMTQEDWNKIVHFYLNESENSIATYEILDQKVSENFKPHIFSMDSIPLITMVSFHIESGHLYLGDANNSALITVDLDGKIINSELLKSPPVKIAFHDSLDYVLTIGNLNPSDAPKGALKIGDHIIDGLIRPVDFLIKDVNNDGYNDVFICNYGNNIGDFSLFENLKNETYNKKVIQPLSGAIKVECTNMDEDEAEEIVVLFAQEHELIMVWNVENGTFNGEKVAQFQPAFGSVDFQLNDMDGDGLKDIVIGNGDNSDLSTVLKNFHGIRILLNKGDKGFLETYFFPMHGVSKLVAEDFDQDGDTDILAISNFGNFKNPKFRSVQLLINEGQMKFQPYSINNLPDFRWQTMQVSDYDSDGDLDVFLGSFNLNLGPAESNISDRKNITWVKLENLLR